MKTIQISLITLAISVIASQALAFPLTGETDDKFVFIGEHQGERAPLPSGLDKMNAERQTRAKEKRKIVSSREIPDGYLTDTKNWQTYKSSWDILSPEISYATGRAEPGKDHAQTQVTGSEVPEPGTLVLFGFGLIGLSRAAKKRRN